MAGGQSHLILQYLRNLIHRRGGGGVADRALLERFVRERDEAAFEVLVWRHGPMVLALGQRMLHNPHDAEDVLQATFLTLVRKAGSIGKSESLSSWLYKVAYRIALHARARTEKLRTVDRPIEDVPAAEESEEAVWDELRPLLDAAIERLPEKYRTALVLCDLQGKTYREAAEQLGCAVGTVSTRVTRARQLLRKRLAHHGLSVSVVALSAALAQQTAAMPATLTVATVRAAARLVSEGGAAGIVSASVAELMEGANQAMLLSRFKIVMFLALAAGAVAVGAASRAALRREPPRPAKDTPRAEAEKAPDAKPAEKPTDAVMVSGRVLGPDGKPVKGARLYWPRLPKTDPRTTADIENFDVAERAKTDAEGRFRFELPRSDIHPEWPISLLAAADGYGVDGVALPKDDPSPEATLRLVKDQLIEGRIVSTEGKPMAGVSVRIIGVGKTRKERLDDFLDTWKGESLRGPDKAFGQLSVQMFLPNTLKCAQTVTDKDGRFRIQGAGVERMVMVRLRGRGLPPAVLFVVNRPGFDPTAWNKATRDNTPPEERRPGRPMLLYGPKIEYVAPAGRRIEGTVREADTGKPVPGYRIFMYVPNGFDISAVSNKEGEYKLLGAPKLEKYRLFALPPANSAWLPGAADGKDAAGLRTIQVDFTVARGIVVRGRILDRATGKGVRAGVRFAPLPGNKFFGKPGYDYYKYAQQESKGTDVHEPGRYQLAVMPGPGVLMVQAHVAEKANGGQKLNPYKQAEFDAKDREHVKISQTDDGDRSFLSAVKNYSESLSIQHAVKVLDLAPDAGTVKCDLFLERGATRTIQIEDADGKPLMGTTISGVTASGRSTFTIKDTTCTVFALDPKKPRRLFLFHAKRHLAGTRTLRGDEKEPVVVRLKSTGSVIGRLLDRDGQPLAGVDVNLILSDQTGFELYRVAHSNPRFARTRMADFGLKGSCRK